MENTFPASSFIFPPFFLQVYCNTLYNCYCCKCHTFPNAKKNRAACARFFSYTITNQLIMIFIVHLYRPQKLDQNLTIWRSVHSLLNHTIFSIHKEYFQIFAIFLFSFYKTSLLLRLPVPSCEELLNRQGLLRKVRKEIPKGL